MLSKEEKEELEEAYRDAKREYYVWLFGLDK